MSNLKIDKTKNEERLCQEQFMQASSLDVVSGLIPTTEEEHEYYMNL